MEPLTLEVSKSGAESILQHSEIYRTICDDGSPNREYLTIPEGWLNVVAYVDGNPVGCFVLHPVNSVTMECHVQVLPDYRHLSAEIGREVINWTSENTNALKLIAWIPFDCENVRIFAESMGFKVEGISEGSIMKKGKLLSQWLVGLRLWA